MMRVRLSAGDVADVADVADAEGAEGAEGELRGASSGTATGG